MPLNVELKGLVVVIDVEDSPVIQWEGEMANLACLQLSTPGQERRVQLCKEPLSRTKEIWSETGYIKWDQRDALEKQAIQ